MNVALVIILASFAYVMSETPSSSAQGLGLSLDSLCFVNNEFCHRNDDTQAPKTIKEIDQYYCISGPDFKKIVNKLQSSQTQK